MENENKKQPIQEDVSDFVKSLRSPENIVGEFTDTKQMIKTLLEKD